MLKPYHYFWKLLINLFHKIQKMMNLKKKKKYKEDIYKQKMLTINKKNVNSPNI